MVKMLLFAAFGVLILYMLLMGFLSSQQESMILFPEKLQRIYLQALGYKGMNEDPVYHEELATLLTRLESNKQP